MVPGTLKTVVAIRHVHFEDLGTFEAVLSAAGYKVHYNDVGRCDLAAFDPHLADLLVVLGGPVGLADAVAFPFLAEERAILRARLTEGRPTLGICLGAQLIAATLGATVAPMPAREIGFSPLTLTAAGRAGPLRHLEGVPVMHWHGDAFTTPCGAETLASTPPCSSQAFAMGRALALQFHPEVNACAGIERWLVGHAVELAAANIDPRALREDAARAGPALREAARHMLTEWLDGLDAS